jgi:hypothetical protein
MKPGIYEDLSFEDYAALPAWNFSSVKRLFLSPRAAKYGFGQEKQTDAMKVGSFVHMAVLEPERFDRECVVMPNYHGGCNDDTALKKGYDGGKQAKAAWLKEHEDANIVDREFRDEVLGISSAFEACAPARDLIGASKCELTVVWEDPIGGLMCKARLDALAETPRGYIVTDLKKTGSVRPEAFRSQVGRFKYHLQAAFYMRAVCQHFGREYNPQSLDHPDSFVWLAFENSAPHFARVFPLANTSREAATYELERMLRVLAWCERENKWPDLAEKLVPVDIPDAYDPFMTPDGVGEVEA